MPVSCLAAHRAGRWRTIVLCVVAVAGLASACATAPRRSGAAPTSTAVRSTSSTLPTADAGQWSLVPEGPNPLSPPFGWTGHEVLAAQAGCCGEIPAVALSAFDPTTGTWRRLPVAPLTARHNEAAVWTGTAMVVAGGAASPSGVVGSDLAPAVDGAAWDAASNTWRAITPMPVALNPGTTPTAVWTGHEVLVWSSQPATPGAPGREVVEAYDPATNAWRVLPASGLAPRTGAVVTWTGTELVVWGGRNFDVSAIYADGARLDPTTGTWRRLPRAPVPGRSDAAAVWTGHEVLVWGGSTTNGEIGRGAAYDPTTDRWRALPLSPLRAKTAPIGVWTGRFFIVIGGAAGTQMPVPGPGAAAYDPVTDHWTTLPPAPDYPTSSTGPTAPGAEPVAADQRAYGDAVWTGRQVVLVGGLDFVHQAPRSDGLEWTPTA